MVPRGRDLQILVRLLWTFEDKIEHYGHGNVGTESDPRLHPERCTLLVFCRISSEDVAVGGAAGRLAGGDMYVKAAKPIALRRTSR